MLERLAERALSVRPWGTAREMRSAKVFWKIQRRPVVAWGRYLFLTCGLAEDGKVHFRASFTAPEGCRYCTYKRIGFAKEPVTLAPSGDVVPDGGGRPSGRDAGTATGVYHFEQAGRDLRPLSKLSNATLQVRSAERSSRCEFGPWRFILATQRKR